MKNRSIALVSFCLLFIATGFSQDNKKLLKSLDLFEKRVDSISNAFVANEEIIKEQFNIMLVEQRAEIDKLKQELDSKNMELKQLNSSLGAKVELF